MKLAALFLLILVLASCGEPSAINDIHAIRALAEQGDAQAQFRLGQSYEQGHEQIQDLQAALTWYQKSAQQGNTDAQYHLGLMHERGLGVPVNMEIAQDWFLTSAERGHAGAQYAIGRMYYAGTGRYRADAKQASEWFELAAEQGHPRAQRLLGEMYLVGSGVSKSYFHAYVWLQIAREGGEMSSEMLDMAAHKLSDDEKEEAAKYIKVLSGRIRKAEASS